MENIGDDLYTHIEYALEELLEQGEIAQFSYIAYERMVEWIKNQENTIPISHPIGYNANGTVRMSSPEEYNKDELIETYNRIATEELSINLIYRMVTIVETMLNDLVIDVLYYFPQKIPSKKQIDIGQVLKYDSVEDIKYEFIEKFVHEISYKSPKDYAIEFEKYCGINLLEFPSYHKYIELKTTRDVYIHNDGIANSIYVTKAGVMARVKEDKPLPVTLSYTLERFECCLSLAESLDEELEKIWPSIKRKEAKSKN